MRWSSDFPNAKAGFDPSALAPCPRNVAQVVSVANVPAIAIGARKSRHRKFPALRIDLVFLDERSHDGSRPGAAALLRDKSRLGFFWLSALMNALPRVGNLP